ncbi:hypothetical protein Ddc_17246 [Ditylenchus destructor]|nr:hypothetical protein Ddc_17246 [Ditylenchus destructor]
MKCAKIANPTKIKERATILYLTPSWRDIEKVLVTDQTTPGHHHTLEEDIWNLWFLYYIKKGWIVWVTAICALETYGGISAILALCKGRFQQRPTPTTIIHERSREPSVRFRRQDEDIELMRRPLFSRQSQSRARSTSPEIASQRNGARGSTRSLVGMLMEQNEED